MISLPLRRAFLSVSDKTGLLDFGIGLVSRGFELVSTGGTARALHRGGLDVTPVSEVTGFPEMMDGRVKTLHPLVHGGILARRANAEDMKLAKDHNIHMIDLVCVNLYPFEETAAKSGVGFDDLIEQIDIGGPSLIRAAAKNFHDVLVVTAPAQYSELLTELDHPCGPSLKFRFALMYAAMRSSARYDDAIANELARWQPVNGHFERLPAQMVE